MHACPWLPHLVWPSRIGGRVPKQKGQDFCLFYTLYWLKYFVNTFEKKIQQNKLFGLQWTNCYFDWFNEPNSCSYPKGFTGTTRGVLDTCPSPGMICIVYYNQIPPWDSIHALPLPEIHLSLILSRKKKRQVPESGAKLKHHRDPRKIP